MGGTVMGDLLKEIQETEIQPGNRSRIAEILEALEPSEKICWQHSTTMRSRLRESQRQWRAEDISSPRQSSRGIVEENSRRRSNES
jgi:hypothetical protein